MHNYKILDSTSTEYPKYLIQFCLLFLITRHRIEIASLCETGSIAHTNFPRCLFLSYSTYSDSAKSIFHIYLLYIVRTRMHMRGCVRNRLVKCVQTHLFADSFLLAKLRRRPEYRPAQTAGATVAVAR